MNDVYDVVIHFVRREECRMEESVRKLFTTYTPGGGDDGETTGSEGGRGCRRAAVDGGGGRAASGPGM